MTQQETAVGAATNDEPVVAAEPTLEERIAAATEEEEPAGDEPTGEPAAEDEPELEAEEVDLADDDLPPIQAPVSWPDEDKALFSELPHALQQRVSEREADREKFVQAKSREATQAAQTARSEAAQQVKALRDSQIQQLVALLPEVPAEPSAHLLVNDPAEYASQVDYRNQVASYRRELESHIYGIAQAQQQAEQQQAEASRQASIELLQQEFPDYLDAAKMPELQKQLRSTATALGFSEDELNSADGSDILKLRTATEWKAKAEKFDALMAKQMQKVRAAKDLPRVSRPGSAPAKGAVANQRYQADREAMRRGDRDAAARVFSRFL